MKADAQEFSQLARENWVSDPRTKCFTAASCSERHSIAMARVAALSADAEAKLGTAWPFPTAFELVFSSAADPSDPG